MKGRVLDSKTSAPIEANLQLDIDDNPKKLHQASTDPATGHYNLILPVKSNYSFAVKAEGFITQNVNVIISSDQIYQEIEKDIYLETMDLNPVVKTNKIYFEEGKTTILSGSFKEVEEMIELMKSSPEFLVEISGHTDSRGSLHLKHLLSQDRAERIEEMFISAGIEKKRITTLAFGGTKPIASNDFEGSRRFNRRVEIKILR